MGKFKKTCVCGMCVCGGNAGKAFSRLTGIASRVVGAGEKWITQTDYEGRRVVFFDEGLYWQAKAALDDVDQLCSGECIERAGVEENLNPPPSKQYPMPPPPPPNETTTSGPPLPPKSPPQQKADESGVLLEKAGRRLSQAHEVMEATERIVEVARRSVEKAEVAHRAAGDAVEVSEWGQYWGGGNRPFEVAGKTAAAAGVGRARVLVALAVAIGRASGKDATQGPTDPTGGPG